MSKCVCVSARARTCACVRACMCACLCAWEREKGEEERVKLLLHKWAVEQWKFVHYWENKVFIDRSSTSSRLLSLSPPLPIPHPSYTSIRPPLPPPPRSSGNPPLLQPLYLPLELGSVTLYPRKMSTVLYKTFSCHTGSITAKLSECVFSANLVQRVDQSKSSVCMINHFRRPFSKNLFSLHIWEVQFCGISVFCVKLAVWLSLIGCFCILNYLWIWKQVGEYFCCCCCCCFWLDLESSWSFICSRDSPDVTLCGWLGSKHQLTIFSREQW